MKVATEAFDVVARPDDLDRDGAARLAPAMYRDHVRGRLSGVGPRALLSQACLYTMSSTADFRLRPRAPGSRITVVSACSGHGFKHSAAVGELAALAAAGRPATPDVFLTADR